MRNRSTGVRLVRQAFVGAALLLASIAAGVQFAHAAEIIPAVGMTRPVDGNQTRAFGSLSLRTPIVPILAGEVGVAYRTEEVVADQLTARMWPVTASLWVTPVPALYAGGGVGWYNVTLDYDEALPIEDETRQEFGVHLGGGMRVPIAASAAVDLGGRYVMMRDQESQLIPESFDPDFWSLAAGLAFRF